MLSVILTITPLKMACLPRCSKLSSLFSVIRFVVLCLGMFPCVSLLGAFTALNLWLGAHHRWALILLWLGAHRVLDFVARAHRVSGLCGSVLTRWASDFCGSVLTAPLDSVARCSPLPGLCGSVLTAPWTLWLGAHPALRTLWLGAHCPLDSVARCSLRSWTLWPALTALSWTLWLGAHCSPWTLWLASHCALGTVARCSPRLLDSVARLLRLSKSQLVFPHVF